MYYYVWLIISSYFIFQLLILASLHDNGQTKRRFSESVLRDLIFTRPLLQQHISSEADILVRHLKQLSDHDILFLRIPNAPPMPFDPTSPLLRAVNNVLCSLLFGERCSKDPEFEHKVLNIEALLRKRTLAIAYVPLRLISTLNVQKNRIYSYSHKYCTYSIEVKYLSDRPQLHDCKGLLQFYWLIN